MTMKRNLLHVITAAFVIAAAAILASCTKDKMSQWKTYFGYTAEELVGSYMPNPDEWDKYIPDEVEKAQAVKNAQASITKTSDNAIFVRLLGMPQKVDDHFSCTIYNNDFMFNSGNLSVKVYKNSNDEIRLSGYVKYPIGQLYDPALGDPINHLASTYEYYYFDIIKQ